MTTYTVTETGRCRLIKGSVPISAFMNLSKGMSKDAVLDPHAARLLDVTYAIGTPDDLKVLSSDPAVIAAARQRAQVLGAGLSKDAIEWLAIGQQGVSSLTIFQRLTGKNVTDHERHPSDPADFDRCRLLFEQVPEFSARKGELSIISPVWANLVAEWGSLCALMDSEVPGWRSGQGNAAQTYARMRELGC